MSHDTQGLTRGNTLPAASSDRSDGDTLKHDDSQPVYRGQRDSTAQLAIAVLAHAYGDEFAKSNYQRLKDRVISELLEDGWSLSISDLDAWRREVINGA